MATNGALSRKLNMALVGGGQGAFIGRVHATAAVLDNRAVVRDAIAIFGTERCLFASNFPVDSLVADFGTIFSGYREITRDLPDGDVSKLFHDNALRFYRLKEQTAEEGE